MAEHLTESGIHYTPDKPEQNKAWWRVSCKSALILGCFAFPNTFSFYSDTVGRNKRAVQEYIKK